MEFKVIVIGAGIGGLSAAIFLRKQGHNVTVLEQYAQLSEVGAGVQIPPNSSRILDMYGMTERLEKVVVKPSRVNFRRYANGNIIVQRPLSPEMVELYGFPSWTIHRADYQLALNDAAIEAGVNIRMGCRVLSVDSQTPAVHFEDGTTLEGDLIIGADGIRSKVRASILGVDDVHAEPSPHCAYRAIVPRDLMMSDPVTAELMTSPATNCWIGYERHIVGYPIRSGTQYNIFMAHPGKASVGRWNEPGDVAEMRMTYDDFEPTIQKALSYVDGTLKWLLADMPPLKRWRSESGRVIVLGDAAHATLPYLSQGAAQATEDAAVLAECLARCKSSDDIPRYMEVYERIRKPRTTQIQQGSRHNGVVWHLPDGDAQQRRDRAMGGKLRPGEENPNLFGDKGWVPWMYGMDVAKDANEQLDAMEKGHRELARNNL